MNPKMGFGSMAKNVPIDGSIPIWDPKEVLQSYGSLKSFAVELVGAGISQCVESGPVGPATFCNIFPRLDMRNATSTISRDLTSI